MKNNEMTKRKISIFTVILWLMLIVIMSVITVSGIVKSNSLEENTRKITVRIDFGNYLKENNIVISEDIEEFFTNYRIIGLKNKVENDYGDCYYDCTRFINFEENRVGIYEVELPKDVKYFIVDFDKDFTSYYDVIFNSKVLEEIQYNEIYNGFEIDENIGEYNIKLKEKEKTKATVRVDFGVYFQNNGLIKNEEIEKEMKEYAKNIIAIKSKFINSFRDCYEKPADFIRSEENRIGIYEVEIYKEAQYIVVDYAEDMCYYSIVSDNNELIKFCKGEYVSQRNCYGFKINDNIEEYDVRYIEEGKRIINLKYDFSEYFEANNITDIDEIEDFLEQKVEIKVSKTTEEEDFYRYSRNIRYVGAENSTIGIYEIKVPKEINYIIIGRNNNVIVEECEIEEIKDFGYHNMYYGFKLEDNINEYNVKWYEKPTRKITVKIDFKEYIENENISEEYELYRLLDLYSRCFNSSLNQTIDNNECEDFSNVEIIDYWLEDETIGVYELLITEGEKYICINEETRFIPKYEIINKNGEVLYVYNKDISGNYAYYAQRILNDIDEYYFKFSKKEAKELILDISDVFTQIKFEIDEDIEYDEVYDSIEVMSNDFMFSSAEFVEANNEYAIFKIYEPRDLDFDIVFDPSYEVFFDGEILDEREPNDMLDYSYDDKSKYYKNIKKDEFLDSYNFKLNKRFAKVKIKINGIDNITEEISNKIKEINVEARYYETGEVVSKLNYLNNLNNVYTFISDKTYAELKYSDIYVALADIGEYSVIDNYKKEYSDDYYNYYNYNNMSYNSFNIEKNIWEHKEDLYDKYEINIELYYNKIEKTSANEKRISFSSFLGKNIPMELYENIIIFHKGSRWVFDRIDGNEYVYKLKNTNLSYDTDVCDIYIPEILNKNIKGKINNKEYIVETPTKEVSQEYYNPNNYIVLSKEINSLDNIMLQNLDEDVGIYKDVEFIDEEKATLTFSYKALRNMAGYDPFIMYPDYLYVTKDTGYILFKENLPEDFKISDEYLNNSEWVFLDDISDKEFRFPNTIVNNASISEDLINELFDGYYWSLIGTGKKYVYVKSTNTLYYLVDDIEMYGSKEIKIEYTGNGNIENSYIVDNDIDAYYFVFCVWSGAEGSENPHYRSYINKYNLTEIEIEKKWEDEDNKNRVRPNSITVELKNGDKVIKEKKLSSENNWKNKIYYVPEYEYKLVKNEEDEETIEEIKTNYTIDEKNVPEHYEKRVEGYVITNRYLDEIKDVNENDDNDKINDNDVINMPNTSDVNIMLYICIAIISIIVIVVVIVMLKKRK